MTDTVKVSALDSITLPFEDADIVYIIRDVSGLKTSLKTTWGDILAATLAAAEAAIIVPPAVDITKVAHTTITGAHTYTVSTDAGNLVRHNDAAATTATIATHATSGSAFAVDQVVAARQVGAGQLTIAPASGVTLNIPDGCLAKARAQGSVMMIHQVAIDTWDLTGDLALA